VWEQIKFGKYLLLFSSKFFLTSRVLSKNQIIKTYKPIILYDVVYECETWSLTIRGKDRLKMFKNKVPKTEFEPKKEGVKGG